MWFVSGIGMVYMRGMPDITPEEQLSRMPRLDATAIHVTPGKALQRAQLSNQPEAVALTTILDRPAYRFQFYEGDVLVFIVVFADNGELLQMTPELAREAALNFFDVPEDQLHFEGELREADQWMLVKREFLPVHKFTVDDAESTQLYVSMNTGEVVMRTTRRSRALAWVSAIPHWLYFTALRNSRSVWRPVVLWSSGLATIGAILGLVLAVIQYRKKRPHIPYNGWLRWHYITGAVFGIFTVTWAFSGLLSMEPFFWASSGNVGPAQAYSLRGDLELERFPVALPQLPETSFAKTVEYIPVQGQPYYRVRFDGAYPILVSAATMQVQREPFSIDSMMERLMMPDPNLRVIESTILDDYDAYYYAFDRQAPLPVLRLKFDDPESTWLYLDPQTSQVVGRAHRRERLQRWIYRGFHSLDFSFWYNKRPLWDIGIVGLSLGGVLLSMIGVVIAWKRLWRSMARSRPL